MASDLVPVWLDCDPGHDDAFAIILGAFHPQIDLLGISTVFGNASLDDTTNNAASLLTAIGKHESLSLHRGLSQPLERSVLPVATDIHGITGLDGTNLLPKPQCQPSSAPAVEAMAARLESQPPNTTWIVATGALTNVGALFRKHPELVHHIKGLSIMGGSLGGDFSDAPLGQVDGQERIGNRTKFAEFNILADPEAASELFSNPDLARKMAMVPLDLSHQVLATTKVRDMLLYGPGGRGEGKGKTTLRQILVELLYFFAKTYEDVQGISEGPPLHDPLAMALVLTGTAGEILFYDWDEKKSTHPKHEERFKVTVITEGTLEEAHHGKETGRTIATELPAGSEGVRIPRGVDVKKFWEVIEECIERADMHNTSLEKP